MSKSAILGRQTATEGDGADSLWKSLLYRDRRTIELQDVEIKQLLDQWGSQKSENNLLLKLLQHKHLSAATMIIEHIEQSDNPAWKDLIETTKKQLQKSPSTVIHDLAAIGFCQSLEPILSHEMVNQGNEYGQTPLHIAAERGQLETVKIFLKRGVPLKLDEGKWTPLHSAAASSKPRPEIVRVLVEELEKSHDLNSPASEGNTALHLAAENPAATSEFIAAFAGMDPTVLNKNFETPMHVAARSTSRANIMMAMLRTFPPEKYFSNVNNIDNGVFTTDRALVSICAVNGNAKAVAELVRTGADLIGSRVLHEIVRESVMHRYKVEGLINVYGAIVDNAVEWWAAKNGPSARVPNKDGNTYYRLMSNVMLHLLSAKKGDDKINAIELAIDIGAVDMMLEIFNTEHIYMTRLKLYSNAACFHYCDTFTICEHGPSDDKLKRYPPTMTYLRRIINHDEHWKESDLLSREPFRHVTLPMLRLVSWCFTLLGIIQLVYMILFTRYCLPSRCALIAQFRLNFTDCNELNFTDSNELNFTDYDGLNFTNYDGLNFTDYDGLNFTVCDNGSKIAPGCENDSNTALTADPHQPIILWFLIWPALMTIVVVVCLIHRLIDKLGGCCCCQCSGRDKLTVTENLCKLASVVVTESYSIFPKMAFCLSVFVWYIKLQTPPNAHRALAFYLESTSVVFLFGWIATLSLFSGTSRGLYTFTVILGEIIVKDIVSSFLPVFVFFMIGYGLAIHTLNQITLPIQDFNSINLTMFQVIMAGLAVTDKLSDTSVEYIAHGGRYGFYRVIYASLICFMTIVLMNVLIAMMGNRYQEAKIRATNVWRFESIRMALPLFEYVHDPCREESACCYALSKLLARCRCAVDDQGGKGAPVDPSKMLTAEKRRAAMQESRSDTLQFRHATAKKTKKREKKEVVLS